MSDEVRGMSSWSQKQIIIAIIMVITGSINTLSTKWADQIQSVDSAGKLKHFNHPLFQADGMFLGEIMCILAFLVYRYQLRRKHRGREELSPVVLQDARFPKVIFYLPSVCDMLATSTAYIGLTLTYASSFQMLRGAVIIFTGLLSVAFLGRKLKKHQWSGIVFVIFGLIVVGLSDLFSETNSTQYSTNGIITGDLLIIAAQIIQASQMVIEEKFVTKYNVPPLQAVGWEGIFGFMTLSLFLVPFYFIPAGIFSGNPRGVIEDPYDAFVQLSNNKFLMLAILGNIISISFFNFSGVSVTKEASATTRMVLDSVRTLVVWIFSLVVGWQSYYFLQPIGFAVLAIGMFLYNDVIIMPFIRKQWQGGRNIEVDGDQQPISSNMVGGSDIEAIA